MARTGAWWPRVSLMGLVAAGLTACGGGADTENAVTPLTPEADGTKGPATDDTTTVVRSAGCPGKTYGTGEIALVMLDARTGALCYRFDSERLDVDMVVVAHGLLVTAEYDERGALLIARELTDGVERWSVRADYDGPRGYLPGTPAGTGGGIITALSADGTLEGIGLDDGTVRWTADLGIDPDHPPVLR